MLRTPIGAGAIPHAREVVMLTSCIPCPECDVCLAPTEGCALCPRCGWSPCKP